MPPSDSRPSTLHLPQGDWPTVLDCLCERFPAIDRATWLDRMARGRVLDADMQPIDAARPYRVGMRVHYFREVPNETPVPFEERILHVDEHLVGDVAALAPGGPHDISQGGEQEHEGGDEPS